MINFDYQVEKLTDDLNSMLETLNRIGVSLATDTNTLENLNNGINYVKQLRTELSKISDENGLNTVAGKFNNIKDSLDEIININAIYAFDELQEKSIRPANSIKNTLDDYKKLIGSANFNGDTTANVIRRADNEIGKMLDNIIKTDDQVEQQMGLYTESRLNMVEDNKEKVEATLKGVDTSGAVATVEFFENNLKELKEQMALNFPNGKEGLSNIPDVTDEFSSGLSDLERYNELQKQIVQAEIDLKNAKNEVGDIKTTGYMEMYEDVARAVAQVESIKPVLDAATDPTILLFDGEEKYNQSIKEALKTEIKPTVNINELKAESDLIQKNTDAYNKLMDSGVFTDKVIDRVNSEENLNNILRERRKLEDSEKQIIDSMKSVKGLETDFRVNFDDKSSLAQFETYRANLKSGVTSINELIDRLHKAQNNINKPDAEYGLLGTDEVTKLQSIKNLLSNGFRKDLTDFTDLKNIKTLEYGLKLINEELNKFKTNNISDKVIIGTKQISQLQAYKKELSNINTNDSKHKYVEQYYAMKQAEQEIEVLRELQSKYNNTESQSFNTEKASEYANAIKKTEAVYNNIKSKVDATQEKAQLLGVELPKVGNFEIKSPLNVIESFKKDRDKKIEKDLEENQRHIEQFKKQLETLNSQATVETGKELDKVNKEIEHVYRQIEKLENKESSIRNNRNAEYKTNVSNVKKEFDEVINSRKRAADAQKREAEAAARKEAEAARTAAEAHKNAMEQVKSAVKEGLTFVINTVTKAINAVKFVLSTIGKTATFIVSGFRGITSITQRIISLIGNFGDRIKGVNKNTNILKGSWTELNSAINLVSNAINKLTNNKFIQEGMKLLSSIETMNTLVGYDLTDSTIEWAKSLEKAFGVDSAGLVADLKDVTAIMKGLGMSAEDTNTAAKNLIMLGQSLSAIEGLSVDTVMNKIYSGMRGMTQSIDDLGLSVREAAMNDFLKELKATGGEFANISTKFSEMTEQQRVYVRYAALMKQFLDMMGGDASKAAELYAKSLESTTGKMNIFSQRMRALTQLIGNFALQLVNKIILPVTHVIDVLINKLHQLFSVILRFFGIDSSLLDLTSGMNQSTVTLDDLADSYDNATDSTNANTEATKENNKVGLDSWDKVSTIGSSKSSSSLGSDAFDYSKLMGLASDYASALEELANNGFDYSKILEKAFDDMLDGIKKNIEKWYKDVSGRDWTLKFNFELDKLLVKQIAGNVAGIIKNIFDTIGATLINILTDINIDRIITDILLATRAATGFIKVITERFVPIWMDFYDKYLKDVVEKLGDNIDKALDKIKTGFDNLTLNATLGFYDDDMQNGLLGAKDIFDEIFKIIGNIAILIKGLVFGYNSQDEIDSLTGGWKIALGVAQDLHSILGNIIDIIAEVISSLDGEPLRFLADTIDRISKFISQHKEDIASILSKLMDTYWEVIETAINKILEIFEWLVNHKDGVNDTLEIIGDLLSFIVDNIEIILAIGLIAKIGLFIGKLTYAKSLLDAIIGIASAVTGAGAATTAAEAGAGAAGAAEAGVAGAAGVGAIAAVGIGGVTAVASILSLPKQLSLLFDNVDLAIKEIHTNIENAGFNATEVTNQARAVALKLKESGEEELLSDEYINKLSEAYKQMLLNSGFTEDQAKTLVSQFTSELNNSISNESINSLELNTDTSVAEAQIGQFFDMIDNNINIVKGESIDFNTEPANSKISSLSNFFDGLTSKIDTLNGTLNGMSKTWHFNLDFSTNLQDVQNKLNNTMSTITSNFSNNSASVRNIRTFYGHANGGIPSSGSLFFANENGNAELVGNFGGYTGVANQGQILSALTNAIKSGLGNNSSNNLTINVGNMIGDQAAINELAARIQSTINNNNNTVANSGFRLS